MKSLKSIFKLLFINICVTLTLLLILEIVLHTVFTNSTNRKITRFASMNQLVGNGESPLYVPHRYLGYSLTPNLTKGLNKHNSLGLRGPEIAKVKKPGQYRVVCVGGSTTYTTGVKDYRKSYPYLLQVELNNRGFDHIEVINAGVGGWSSWESFINFQLRLLDLSPDMIIVYHGLNDIHSRLVWPPENYQSDNSGRRAPLTTRSNWNEFLFEQSNILRILGIKFGVKKSNLWLAGLDRYPNSLYYYEFVDQFKNGTYPSGIFNEVSITQMLRKNKPKYFRQNMEAIVDLAKAKGISVVLSTLASSSQFTKELINTSEYATALHEHNQIIREIAIRKEVSCFDFSEKFPNDTSLYLDGRHVTQKGSTLKAKMFADHVAAYLTEKKKQ